MQDDYEEMVTCMIDLEDETQAVFTEKFDQPNIKLIKSLDREVYFEIEVCFSISLNVTQMILLFYFSMTNFQNHHAELVAAIEEKYVDFVTLIPETESKTKKAVDGQICRKSNGRIYIKIFERAHFNRLNTSHTFFMHCLSNRVTFQVTKLCQKFCERDQLIPLLLYNPRFHKREKLEAPQDKIPLS